jgi:hypothetical protein
MLTKNEDVRNAKANGTRARVKDVHLKPGQVLFYVTVDGYQVPATFASSVKELTLEHVNEAVEPRQFTVEPKKFKVKARLPRSRDLMDSKKRDDRYTISMHMLQIPVISNTATTCHKLQGVGVKNLFVSEWCKEASWIYVILSRVTTKNGLYLRKQLDVNLDLFKIPDALTEKLNRFRTGCMREEVTEDEYNQMTSTTADDSESDLESDAVDESESDSDSQPETDQHYQPSLTSVSDSTSESDLLESDCDADDFDDV